MPKFKQGARVRIHPDSGALDTQPPPPGVWAVVVSSPTGTTHWWVQAYDEEARTWVAGHPREVVSGCVVVPAHRLDLINQPRL